MEVQCKVHLQFTWRSSARSISSSHGGPVQGASPVHMEVQLGPITSSHGGPVQGPSPQSGAGAAASQGYIIKVPGLKDEVSTLIICIQARHQFMWDQCNSKGPKRSPYCTPDSELIWSNGYNRGWVPEHKDTYGSTQ